MTLMQPEPLPYVNYLEKYLPFHDASCLQKPLDTNIRTNHQ